MRLPGAIAFFWSRNRGAAGLAEWSGYFLPFGVGENPSVPGAAAGREAP